MKAITINVSEPVYREFQEFARDHDRTAAELIRQAMADYRDIHLRGQGSLRDLQPLSVGRVLQPLSADDDLLGEMSQVRDGR